MKKIYVLLAFCSCSYFISVAQNPGYKNGITIKNLFLDYQSQQGGSLDAFKEYHHGFEIGYQRKLANKLNVYIPVKVANVNIYNPTYRLANEFQHRQIASLDGQLQYHFYSKTNQIVPYILAGVGGVFEFDVEELNLQVPMGLGINFRAADNAYINLQSEYRYSFTENRNNLQHGIGFVYLWPKKAEEEMKEEVPVIEEVMKTDDADGDGIEDKLDLCPTEAGTKALNGCPDKDGDGVADFQDACPDIAGGLLYKGCPDSDGDGVGDHEDKCPTQSGSKMNSGCPELPKDTDGDGIADEKDKCPDYFAKTADGCPSVEVKDKDGDGVADADDRCPDVKGSASLNGCPDSDGDGIIDPDDKCPNAKGLKIYGGCPDSDGDGISDDRDKCPNTPGSVASNGCPDIKIEDRKTLDIAMRAVQFELGKAALKQESYAILKQVASILNRYPDYNLAIGGHTDNTGSSVANQELSEKRAKACYDYIVTQGVSSTRLSYTGFGESRPVADNATENGRSLNRRVEFNLNPR